MASGLSKAHSRQSSANKIRRQSRLSAATTEANQMRRLLRHAKAFGFTIKLGANSSEASFLRLDATIGKLVEDKAATEAWKRCASRVGVAKAREILHERSIPQANTTFNFAQAA